MEEKDINTEKLDTDAAENESAAENNRQKSPFKLWFENFIYHYKWHTIVAIILIITITVCSLQMCSKSSYDVYILYAGEKTVNKVGENGDVSEHVTFMTSMKKVSKDYDEDGSISVSLDTLYMLSDRQIEEIEKELQGKNEEEKEKYTLNYAQLEENNTIFRDRMLYSEYYLCFLSCDLYRAYKDVDGMSRFVSLDGYIENKENIKFVEDSNGTAVYLNSTSFSALPGICDLPDDTVIVLRAKSEVSAHFGKKDNNEIYNRSEEVLKKILNYKG